MATNIIKASEWKPDLKWKTPQKKKKKKFFDDILQLCHRQYVVVNNVLQWNVEKYSQLPGKTMTHGVH